MFAYRFRMNFEEQDGFSRDIELGVDQTFLDLYNIITENLSLDKTLSSSFFLADHRFRKKKEISQPGKQHVHGNPGDDEETMDERRLEMDKCRLNEFIDDPHQKFLFIYDLTKEWTFYIELLKIVKGAKEDTYPRIEKSTGPVPVEISRKPRPLPGIDDEDDLNPDEDGDNDSDETDISSGAQNLYGEEDLDEFDDSSFYNNAADDSQDIDEGKQ